METRSQRRTAPTQPQQQQPYAPFQLAQTAPATPSSFQSSSSLASISSSTTQNPAMMIQTQHPFASAPLPSPSSSSQPNTYFAPFQQQPAPTSHPSQQQPRNSTVAGTYLGQRGDGGGTPETAPFLKDFNLVAEAAKRAQMACLARDFGDVGL